MGRRGTKPTPTAELKVHGTFRKDRHADRADVVVAAQEPEKPTDLDANGSAMWDLVIEKYRGRPVVDVLDASGLAQMCRMWSLCCKAMEAAMTHPLDKEVRCAVTGYDGAFQRWAAKFGLSPTDRANLKIPRQTGKKAVQARTRA